MTQADGRAAWHRARLVSFRRNLEAMKIASSRENRQRMNRVSCMREQAHNLTEHRILEMFT